mmetsp:Transcript_51429/g.58279  ORF Transcript_51429/g.58279 Transcript_51429/m.58279 type:complete len:273 (+) Transcript_51429:76-894(+)
MKFSAAALCLLVGSVSAGTPEINLNLKHGGYNSVSSALAPTLSFAGETEGIEYGVDADFSDPTVSIPKKLWGKKSTQAGGWTLDAKVEASHQAYDFDDNEDAGAYVTVNGADEAKETFVWGSGAASKAGVKPLRVGAKKIFESEAAKFMISPRYDAETGVAEVVLGVEKDDTKAYLTLSEEEQDLLVQHQINDDNSATLKAGATGFISASLTNDSDIGTTVVTVTPDDVDVEVSKDGWTMGVACVAEVRGLANAKPNIRFSKKVDLGSILPL